MSGVVELGSTANIDVSGQWVNDLPDAKAKPYLGPVFRDGGSVQVDAEGDMRLQASSRVDVSGGGWRTADGKLKAGDAGSINLAAAVPEGSNLALDGQLQGYALGGGHGGRLSLASSKVIIGTDASPDTALRLTGDFFDRGGFQNFQITSNQAGVTVQAGTLVNPVVDNRVLDPGFTRQPTGSDLRRFSDIETLPEPARQAAGLNLKLQRTTGDGGPDAAIRVEPGAEIRTDVRGR